MVSVYVGEPIMAKYLKMGIKSIKLCVAKNSLGSGSFIFPHVSNQIYMYCITSNKLVSVSFASLRVRSVWWFMGNN